MSRLYVVILALCVYCISSAQNINVNKQYLNSSKSNIVNNDSSTYYRLTSTDNNNNTLQEVKDFYLNDTLQFQGRLSQALPDVYEGICTWYFPNGNKKIEAYFINGELAGKTSEWYENGRISYEGYFQQDIPNSRHVYWNNNGTFSAVLFYKDQQEVDIIDIYQQSPDYDETNVHTTLRNVGKFLYHRFKKDAADAFAFNYLGERMFAQSRYQEALSFYFVSKYIKELLSLNSNLHIVLNNISETYAALNKGQLAQQYKKEANKWALITNAEPNVSISDAPSMFDVPSPYEKQKSINANIQTDSYSATYGQNNAPTTTLPATKQPAPITAETENTNKTTTKDVANNPQQPINVIGVPAQEETASIINNKPPDKQENIPDTDAKSDEIITDLPATIATNAKTTTSQANDNNSNNIEIATTPLPLPATDNDNTTVVKQITDVSNMEESNNKAYSTPKEGKNKPEVSNKKEQAINKQYQTAQPKIATNSTDNNETINKNKQKPVASTPPLVTANTATSASEEALPETATTKTATLTEDIDIPNVTATTEQETKKAINKAETAKTINNTTADTPTKAEQIAAEAIPNPEPVKDDNTQEIVQNNPVEPTGLLQPATDNDEEVEEKLVAIQKTTAVAPDNKPPRSKKQKRKQAKAANSSKALTDIEVAEEPLAKTAAVDNTAKVQVIDNLKESNLEVITEEEALAEQNNTILSTTPAEVTPEANKESSTTTITNKTMEQEVENNTSITAAEANTTTNTAKDNANKESEFIETMTEEQIEVMEEEQMLAMTTRTPESPQPTKKDIAPARAAGNTTIAANAAGFDWNRGIQQVGPRVRTDVPIRLKVDPANGYYYSEEERMVLLESLSDDFETNITSDPRGATKLVDVGLELANEGNYKKAIGVFSLSKDVWKQNGSPDGETIALGNMGYAYQKQKDFDTALTYYDEVESRSRNYGLTASLAQVLQNKGDIYYQKNSPFQAIAAYQEAANLYRKTGNLDKLAEAENKKGHAYYNKGDYDKAVSSYQQARKAAEEGSNEALLSDALNNIATLSYIKGNYDEAIKQYLHARNIAEREFHEPQLAALYNNIGVQHHLKGDLAEAENFYQRAYKIWESLGRNEQLRTPVSNLAVLFIDMGAFEKAMNKFSRYNELKHKQYHTTDNSTHRQLSILTDRGVFDKAINTALNWSQPEKAFIYIETLKNQQFAEALAVNTSTSFYLDNDIHQEEKQLLNHLQAINYQLTEASNDTTRQELLAERAAVINKLEDFTKTLRVRASEYSALKYPTLASIEAVQAVILPNEVVLNYFVGEENIYVILIAKNLYQSFKLENATAIEVQFDQFKTQFIDVAQEGVALGKNKLLKKAEKAYPETAFALYQSLIQPVEASGLLGDKDLIIIPDGFLNYLPFEALLTDATPQFLTDYNYLIRTYHISYYPSSTTLTHERENAFDNFSFSSENLLVLADPILNGTQKLKKLDVIEAGYYGMRQGAASNYMQPVSKPLTDVSGIQEHFTKNTTILTQGDASETALKSYSKTRYRNIHFAAPAVLNSKYPEMSLIALTETTKDDGLFNLHEIMSLQLSSNLISLPICINGIGRSAKGTDVSTWVRGLMYAGTPSVIYSLWHVPSKANTDFFATFYENLKQGDIKSNALYNTKIQLINNGQWAHPIYWASFVLSGEK